MHVSWRMKTEFWKLYEDHIVIYWECEQIADINARAV